MDVLTWCQWWSHKMASLDLNSEVLWLLNIMDWFKEAILISSSEELFVWVMFSHTGQDKLSLVTLKPSRSCSRCSSFVSGQCHFACWYFLYLMLLWWTSGLKWLLCVLWCFSLSEKWQFIMRRQICYWKKPWDGRKEHTHKPQQLQP